MHRCLLNPALERVRVNGFAFPLGVYPVEPIAPATGYTVDFEPADGDEEWEEWPDRYVYEILVSAERLRPICSAILSLLPGRVYPILDVLGNDAFREIDPYIAYELVGVESLYDGIRWYEPFLFEDGLCGFGAMSEEPFMYFFLDEHKVLTVRVESRQKERVDRLLTAFELPNLAASPKGGAGASNAHTPRPRRSDGQPLVEVMAADAVSHEHRSVLLTPDERPELPGPEEVTESLVDLWGMTLNIDVERNLDDDGRELGVTGWRCLVRVEWPADAPPPAQPDRTAKQPGEHAGQAEHAQKPGSRPATGEKSADQAHDHAREPQGRARARMKYAEVLVAAGCWREAEELGLQAAMKLPEAPQGVALTDEYGPRLITADRLWRHEVVTMLAGTRQSASPQAAAPEAHAPRSQESESPAGQLNFDDPHQPEPPEIAALLDEAFENGAPGRILSSRWLE